MAEDFAHAFHVDEATLKKYFAHARGKDSFQIIVSLARPRQRGEMFLKSSNPMDPIGIDPKYLQTYHDVQVLVEGGGFAMYFIVNFGFLWIVFTQFQNFYIRYQDGH